MPIQPLDHQTLESLVARWDEATAHLEPESAAVPMHVLLGDAVDLAVFVETHYEPVVAGHVPRPGLSSVEAHSGITRETAGEIFELQAAISFVHAQLRVSRESSGDAPLATAQELIGKLRDALAFLLEGVDDAEGHATLRSLRSEWRYTRAHDAVALMLESYAALGLRYVEQLEEIGVERALLTAALAEAKLLRARSAGRIVRRVEGEGRDLVRLRNRLVAALQSRLRLVRRAIRYVFRDHPDLARHASSAYVRIRRVSAARGDAVEPPPSLAEAS